MIEIDQKVDICVACLAEHPPALPLREEVRIQGVEAILLDESPIPSTRTTNEFVSLDNNHDNSCDDSSVVTATPEKENSIHWLRQLRQGRRGWSRAVSYQTYSNSESMKENDTDSTASGNLSDNESLVSPHHTASLLSSTLSDQQHQNITIRPRNDKEWYRVNCHPINPVCCSRHNQKDTRDEPDIHDVNDCFTLLMRLVDEGCLNIISPHDDSSVSTVPPLRVPLSTSGGMSAEIPAPLISICGRGFSSPSELQIHLDHNPSLARIVASDGRLPLHVIATRGMKLPHHELWDLNEPGDEEDPRAIVSLVGTMGEDAVVLRDVLQILLRANRGAACLADKMGDLPCHLLGRQLWRWDKSIPTCEGWDTEGFREVSRVLSQCVDGLLKPLLGTRMVCRARGSRGVLLPIHLAVIFGAEVETVRGLLKMYGKGASVKCENALPGLKYTLPIELLECRRPTLNWNNRLDVSGDEEDVEFDQKSDIIFCYHPILPYRREVKRLRRVESVVHKEAKMAKSHADISDASKSIFIFFCTFINPNNLNDHYEDSVRRIIDGLEPTAFSSLTSTPTKDGITIAKAATEHVSALMKSYITKILTRSSNVKMTRQPKSALRKGGKLSQKPKTRAKLNDLLSPLCRLVFDVPEQNVPTSFIVLPYKLKRGPSGLGLMHHEDAPKALSFAETLVEINNTTSVKHLLNGLTESSENVAFERARQKFLSCYKSAKGYLYLIDELLGVPVVDSDDAVYPFEIINPAVIINKILPLMQMGMLHMRGDKGLVVLAQVLAESRMLLEMILDERVLEKLKMYSDGRDMKVLKSVLSDVLSSLRSQDKLEKEKSYQWKDEISWLQILYDTFDDEQYFAGMSPVANKQGAIFWTASRNKKYTAFKLQDSARGDLTDEQRDVRTPRETDDESEMSEFVTKQAFSKNEPTSRKYESSTDESNHAPSFNFKSYQMASEASQMSCSDGTCTIQPSTPLPSDDEQGEEHGLANPSPKSMVSDANSIASKSVGSKRQFLSSYTTLIRESFTGVDHQSAATRSMTDDMSERWMDPSDDDDLRGVPPNNPNTASPNVNFDTTYSTLDGANIELCMAENRSLDAKSEALSFVYEKKSPPRARSTTRTFSTKSFATNTNTAKSDLLDYDYDKGSRTGLSDVTSSYIGTIVEDESYASYHSSQDEHQIDEHVYGQLDSIGELLDKSDHLFESDVNERTLVDDIWDSKQSRIFDEGSFIQTIEGSSLCAADEAVFGKDYQINELQSKIDSFDQEEQALMREKEKLIHHLEQELEKYDDEERIVRAQITDMTHTKEDISVCSSIPISPHRSEISLSLSLDELDWMEKKLATNDCIKEELISKVDSLESSLTEKEAEIEKLKTNLKQTHGDVIDKKDEEILKLMKALSLKEEELRDFEGALEQYIKEY